MVLGKISASRFWPLACSIGLLAITAWLYTPAGGFGFVTWDDPVTIVANPHLAGGLTVRSAIWALTSIYNANWLPLTWWSYLADVTIFGKGAFGHHVTNVAIHLCNTVLLFVVLQRMTGELGRSWFVAALFALHPLHVESVAWVSERKDVLSALFFFLTLWAYASYARRPSRGRLVLTLVPCVLATMAKPMVVTLPVVLLLLDVWPLRRAPERWTGFKPWGALVREKTPFAIVAAAASGVAVFAQRQAGAVARLGLYPLPQRLANATMSYAGYLRKALWPSDLGPFYPLRPGKLPASPALAAAACVLGAISFLTWRERRRRPYLAVGWLFYLVMLVPVIGLIQVGDQAMADRYTYLPLIGIFVMAAWGIPDLLGSWRYRTVPLAGLSLVLCVGLAGVSRGQLAYWRDSHALWARALSVAPDDNFRAHAGLADAWVSEGRLEDAIAEYREALKILPGSAEVHDRLGVALDRQGQSNAARVEYLAATRLDSADPEAHNNLGSTLARDGDTREAIVEYREALRLDPAFAQAQYNLGLALAAQGELDQGIRDCLEALQIDSTRVEWHHGVARLLARAGRQPEAIVELQTALSIDPSDDAAREVLEALGQLPPRR